MSFIFFKYSLEISLKVKLNEIIVFVSFNFCKADLCIIKLGNIIISPSSAFIIIFLLSIGFINSVFA